MLTEFELVMPVVTAGCAVVFVTVSDFAVAV
jgi:hypothetical protein